MNPVIAPIGKPVTSGRNTRTQSPGDSSEPAEFISNGNFNDGSTDWNVGAGWNVVADATDDGVSGGLLIQNFGPLTAPLINGNDYLFTANLSYATGDRFRIQLTDGTTTQILGFVSSDPISIPFTANAAHHTLSIVNINRTEVGGDAFDNFSLVPAP